MSFKIKLNNISVPSGNQFKVFYKLDSRTPGSVASQGEVTWGTLYGTYTGGTTTNIEIDFFPIITYPYGKQHWFKILDTVTGSYIIENIYIHEYEYYEACLATPTPTPTPTSTPTPTPTSTPIPTATPEPTATPIPTSTPEPTATPIPDCVVDIEYATVVSPQKLYWNFATIGEQTWSTVMRFRIQKNGIDYVNTTGSTQNNTQYIEPLENWMGNTSVSPGDAIIFTVTTVTSGSGGNTIGSMGTYTTTGTSGYMPNVSGTPVAPNAITLNSQSVDPDGGSVTYSFTVTSGVNYGLNCTYFQ